MKAIATWVVDLPIRFSTSNEIKRTSLSKLSYNINNVDVDLLINPKTQLVEKVKIQISEEYDESFLPSYKNIEYLSDFSNSLTYKAGSAIQSFLDGFSKHTDDKYHHIFDGEDFITPYRFSIQPNILSGSGNNGNSYYFLDDEIINKSIEFANKKKNIMDNAWYLIRDAEHSMEIGKYEISIVYMAIMLEFLVASHLSLYLKEDGTYKQPHKTKIEKIYGKRPSFANRHFKYGVSLITDHKLPDDIILSVDFIYKMRNKIAHGTPLYEIDIVNENNIKEFNIRYIWFDLINDITEVYNFFNDIIKK